MKHLEITPTLLEIIVFEEAAYVNLAKAWNQEKACVGTASIVTC
jgi:hypothetical protein